MMQRHRCFLLLSLLAACTGVAVAQSLSPVILTQQDSAGSTVGLILHSFSYLVTAQNPAQPGEVLTLFATGLGPTNPAVTSGAAAPVSPPAVTTASPTISVGCQHASVISSALAPGAVGIYEVIFALPAGAPGGNQPLSISIGGVASNTVMLPVAGSAGPAISAVVNGSFSSTDPIAAPGTILSVFACGLGTTRERWTGLPASRSETPRWTWSFRWMASGSSWIASRRLTCLWWTRTLSSCSARSSSLAEVSRDGFAAGGPAAVMRSAAWAHVPAMRPLIELIGSMWLRVALSGAGGIYERSLMCRRLPVSSNEKGTYHFSSVLVRLPMISCQKTRPQSRRIAVHFSNPGGQEQIPANAFDWGNTNAANVEGNPAGGMSGLTLFR